MKLQERLPGLSAIGPDWSGAIPVGLCALVACTLVAASAARYPLVTLAAGGAVAAICLGAFSPSIAKKVSLTSVGLLLCGYAFLGKGFAYLPAPPIFVGEIVLLLGVGVVVLTGAIRLVFGIPIAWLILAFAVDGALRTVPYLGKYGLDALRDAAIWGYGAYAIIVCALVLRLGWLPRVIHAYARLVPWFLFAIPAVFILQNLAKVYLPVVPGAPQDLSIPHLKPGDVAVHLAGAGVFLILGLNRMKPNRRGITAGVKEWFFWFAWLAGILAATSINRGGLVAVILALMVTFLLRPFGRWGKPLALVLVVVAGLVVANLKFDIGTRRGVSLTQWTSNIVSVVQATGDPSLDGTRAWRLQWWQTIFGYTVHGPYFWMGKGYGINLADDDGFQVTPDHALRSPHNSHMTVLARAGIPGMFLWLLLQGWFAFSMVRAYLRARGLGLEDWACINLWILAYWTAFVSMAAFDVSLEGPQAGIWFWCLIGFGMAALETQRRTFQRPSLSKPITGRAGLSRSQ